jgi:uncharacterized protein DUF4258
MAGSRTQWRHPKAISEHAFDKLHVIDCALAELETALDSAEIIDERALDDGTSKEMLLVVDWKRPLHVVVVVDDVGREERIVTVYEPLTGQWTADYRRRR